MPWLPRLEADHETNTARNQQMIKPADIGDSVDAICTPSLVIDLDAMERNIAHMASWASRHNIKLRPHAKTHKSAVLARQQIAAGAVGICVQKLSEAEALAELGVENIYISNEIIDPSKLERVVALAQRIKLAIAVDSDIGIERLAGTFRGNAHQLDVFLEVDVGQGRCGVAPDQAGRYARKIVDAGLHLAGLQAYHGKVQHIRDVQLRKVEVELAANKAMFARKCVEEMGLAVPIITGGGTGSFEFDALTHVYDELQPGSYVFMDRDYSDNERSGGELIFEHALFIKSQVISRQGNHAVVDAGHKSHAIDSGLPGVLGDEFIFHNAGDEHGLLTSSANRLPEIGGTVWLIPGHCDPTVNLHDFYVGVRGGLKCGTVESIIGVDARGCIF